jgi:predicted nucleic acid-binding Zn ribbon protein
MTSEAARLLARRMWEKGGPPKDKACAVCGRPCRRKFCSNICKQRDKNRRKREQQLPFE